MSTGREKLHPQAAEHLRAAAAAPTVASLSVAEARLEALGFLDLQRPSPTVAEVLHRFIPGPTADLPVRILYPATRTGGSPVVIVLHGSGWVIANLDIVDEPARVLARDTGFVVITVNYQKAPEHRFPIPLDDCVAAISWVHAHAAELGVDPGRIAVVGDSAGGNLAAAAVNELLGAGIRLAAQALLYPALDRAMNTDSYAEFGQGFGLDRADMAWFWNHYVDVSSAADPRVSPLRAAEVANVPTFVATAGHDVLRDEGEAYAALVQGSGTAVTARRYEGMIHGFWWMDGVLDDARTLQLDLAEFLRSTLG